MVMTRNSTTGEGLLIQSSVSGVDILSKGIAMVQTTLGLLTAYCFLRPWSASSGSTSSGAANLHPPIEDGQRVSGVVAGEEGG